MKYAAYGIVAAFLGMAAFGAVPTTAKDWYTPADGFTAASGTGTIYYGYDRTTGEWQTTTVTIDDQGNVIDGGTDAFLRDYDLATAYEALVKALRNEAMLAVHTEAIETLGKNLYDLTSKEGIHIKNENTKQEFTIKFGGSIASAVSGASGDIPATSDAKDPADNTSLGWTNEGKLELKGWAAQAASGSLWGSFSQPVSIPIRTANGAAMVYGDWYGVDNLSLAPASVSHKLELKGWYSEGSNVMTPLADALKAESKGTFEQYEIVVRNASKGLNYVALGTLSGGDGAPVDGTSITTNVSDGATTQGVASLYGWGNTTGGEIPMSTVDGLAWKTLDELADGTSIASVDGLIPTADRKKLEVKDAHVYAGHYAKRYFGTSSDESATLGWWELPNATTNRVEGDEVTIATNPNIPGRVADDKVKVVGLRGWNYYGGTDPLFLVNNGGTLDYIALPAITNLAACGCTQKWEKATEWIGNGAAIGDGGLTLPGDSLNLFLRETLGFIYSTTPDNLHFDNDGDQIEASFTAPANWPDGESIETTDDGQYQIKGYANASGCAADMSAMLGNPEGSDATTHLFLAKKTDTGALHYVPIGSGLQSGGADVDDETITTNTAHGATTSGLASLYGWSNAGNDTYLSKNESGNLEWRQVSTMPEVDNITISTNNLILALKGFSDAPNDSIARKDENGNFVWGGASSVTNRIVAGAGINITDNGGGAVTISAQAFTSGSQQSAKQITVVTDVRYDETSHKFQKKTQTITFTGTLGTESGWTDVFTAVSHRSEHETGSDE